MPRLDAKLVISLEDNTARGAASIQRNFRGLISSARKFAGLNQVGGLMQQAGRGISNFARAGRRSFGALLSAGTRFEQSIKDAVVQFNKPISAEMFKALEARAISLGEKTQFTATQVAQGMKFMAQAGLEPQQVLAGIGDMLNLAAAGNLELGKASDIATDIMAQLGLEAKDLGRIADNLVVGSQSATVNIAQMGEAFKKVGPLAAEAGIPLEHLTGIITAFGNVGLKGGIGGRSIRRILLQMKAPSDTAAASLKNLGVTAQDIEKGPLEVFAKLAEARKAMPRDTYLKNLAKAFGAFGVTGAAAAAAQFAKSVEKSTEAGEPLNDVLRNIQRAEDSAGRAAQVAAERMNTFVGSATRLTSALESLAIKASKDLIPVIRPMIDDAVNATKRFSDWYQENRSLAGGLLKAAGAIVLLGTVLGPLITLGGLALSMISRLGGVVLALGGNSVMAGKAVGKLGGVVGKFRNVRGGVIGGALAAGLTGAMLIIDHTRSKVAELHAATARLRADIGGAEERLAGRLSDDSLETRIGLLQKKKATEQRKLDKRREDRGFFEGAADFVFGTQPSSAAVDTIASQIEALQVEQARRRQIREDGDKTKIEQLKGEITIRLDAQGMPVRVKNAKSENAGVGYTIESGLAPAGA